MERNLANLAPSSCAALPESDWISQDTWLSLQPHARFMEPFFGDSKQAGASLFKALFKHWPPELSLPTTEILGARSKRLCVKG